jgi:hypothetical protein
MKSMTNISSKTLVVWLGVNTGQLYVIDPVFSIDGGGLGALFLSHYFLAVKAFSWSPPFREGRLREWACKKLVGAGAPCC